MKAIEARDLLMSRAGITVEQLEAGKDDYMFKAILEAMEKIYKAKQVQYGNYIETHGSEPKVFSLIQHFCDIKRKYVRAEHAIKRMADFEVFELKDMLDTYSDMAVYSAMGVQLLLHIMEREQNERCARTPQGDE